ncbi:nucleotide sugar dehydrogenase [Nostocaceae cyanobacterium CENA369]|uniref:Nucleotide sugar dehydrogenase n=1 Tax=Dendronalium phyllosphericum CENA369 TaxID=1725256 RepID=A0A8J7LD63_9NOST|nr:nucleotide sugar dehydrogenase [Dendronalium phyllosphericum]MBH8571663.1 nucleotide sugar dehydrogenase [Dendronalium phyllosphericum CENA369]
MSDRIAVIGLGYVGLPVALAFAKKFPYTIGFDVNVEKVANLRKGIDTTGEISQEELINTTLNIVSEPFDLVDSNFFVVAVPTPVDRNHRPDLSYLIKASELVGKVLQPGATVVYESTVYPGVTEDICGPTLAKVSGLQQGVDFKLGYSPERINPGDKAHTLEKIVKVVAGEDAETLEKVARVYATIVDAGVYRASSIKVAEAAKAIENTQRDLNIALMNELALICDRLNIRTHDVLAAARTKWNFLPFTPGLVGGHCIGVDPYYLTTKAEELGYHPEVMLAGRRINDSMGIHIARHLVKLLIKANLSIKGARIGILGLTFKENVFDVRNSRVPDIVAELRQFGINPLVHDPLADSHEAEREYGIQLTDWQELSNLDGIVLAVSHQAYLDMSSDKLLACLRPGGVLLDVKSVFDSLTLPSNIHYSSL